MSHYSKMLSCSLQLLLKVLICLCKMLVQNWNNCNFFQFLVSGTGANHHLLHRAAVTAPIKNHWPNSQKWQWMGYMCVLLNFKWHNLQVLNYFCTAFQYSLKRFYTKIEKSYFLSSSKSIYLLNGKSCVLFNFYRVAIVMCMNMLTHSDCVYKWKSLYIS